METLNVYLIWSMTELKPILPYTLAANYDVNLSAGQEFDIFSDWYYSHTVTVSIPIIELVPK